MINVAVIMGKMHSGGKKSLVMEYYRNIDKTQVQFDFICDDDSNSIPYDEIEKLGGRVYLIPRYQKIFSNIRAIIRICKTNKYDIVHGYNGTMNVFAMYAAKKAGVKIRINESISMGHKSDKRNILKMILRPFSKMFTTHFASNGLECGKWQFGKRIIEKNNFNVFKTIINTDCYKYNQDLRLKCRNELNIENKIVFGHIGRLTAQKNTIFLIEIFNEICKIVDNAILMIIGDGDLKEEMLKKINDYNLQDKVLYLGRREDIIQFYNAMDCFLLPSLYEGLPVVGIEAQCLGLPIVFSTEVPKESSPCDDLGLFVDLNKPAREWALKAVEWANKNIRVDHSSQIANLGFNSVNEAKRLLEWYKEIY